MCGHTRVVGLSGSFLFIFTIDRKTLAGCSALKTGMHAELAECCGSDDVPRDRSSQPGQQAGEADNVGRKSWCQQQGAPDQQHDALQEFSIRDFTSVQFFLDPVQRHSTFQSQQPDPANCCQDHEANSSQRADDAPDLNQDDHFNQWDKKK